MDDALCLDLQPLWRELSCGEDGCLLNGQAMHQMIVAERTSIGGVGGSRHLVRSHWAVVHLD